MAIAAVAALVVEVEDADANSMNATSVSGSREAVDGRTLDWDLVVEVVAELAVDTAVAVQVEADMLAMVAVAGAVVVAVFLVVFVAAVLAVVDATSLDSVVLAAAEQM